MEIRSRILFTKEAVLSDGVGETGFVDRYSEPIVFGGGLSDGSNLGMKY